MIHPRCRTGKVAHDTRVSAEDAIRAMKRARVTPRKRVKQLGAYACPFCAYWHVGHSRPKKRKKAA